MENMHTDIELDPVEFLRDVSNAHPGWADKYGGRKGIAKLTPQLHQVLLQWSESIAAVRVAAIQSLLKEQSGAELARELNVTRAAIAKINRNRTWENPQW